MLKQRYTTEADIRLTVEEFILLNMIKVHIGQILQDIATGKNKSVVIEMINSMVQK